MGNSSCSRACSRAAGLPEPAPGGGEPDLDEGAAHLRKGCFTHLLGLDFDLTITTERVYGMRNFDRLPSLFGGHDRLDLLRGFLHRVRNAGCGVLVVSWNFTNIISEALEGVGLAHLVDSIFDRRWVQRFGGFKKGKGRLMRALLLQLGLNADSAVFVDDVPEILSHMPCGTRHVAEEQGMTAVDIDAVYELLQLKPKSADNIEVQRRLAALDVESRPLQPGPLGASGGACPPLAKQMDIAALPLPYAMHAG